MATAPRPIYQHRQGGGFMRVTFLLGLAGLGAAYALDPGGGAALLVAIPLLLLVFAAFDGLLIRVTRDEIAWRFGHFGFPRGRLALQDVIGAEVTRTRFWEGWGIRWTARGWLYNVSGYDAVQIQRRDGKSVLLGTDEPRQLKSAIDTALQCRRDPSGSSRAQP